MTAEAHDAAAIIRQTCPLFKARFALTLGSGLSEIADQIENPVYFRYETLPGCVQSTVEGHEGRFVLGELAGVPVICLQGRAHWYEEDVSALTIKTMVRIAYLMGARIWLTTNATGSLREEWPVGRLVVIRDHVNMQFLNPLQGHNDPTFGPRFFSMENAYDSDLRLQLQRTADLHDIKLEAGVYGAVLGPSFETPAEIQAYKTMGIDLICMSTVPEIIVARHCGMKTACISVVANLAAGLGAVPLSHQLTLAGAAQGRAHLTELLCHFVATCIP